MKIEKDIFDEEKNATSERRGERQNHHGTTTRTQTPLDGKSSTAERSWDESSSTTTTTTTLPLPSPQPPLPSSHLEVGSKTSTTCHEVSDDSIPQTTPLPTPIVNMEANFIHNKRILSNSYNLNHNSTTTTTTTTSTDDHASTTTTTVMMAKASKLEVVASPPDGTPSNATCRENHNAHAKGVFWGKRQQRTYATVVDGLVPPSPTSSSLSSSQPGAFPISGIGRDEGSIEFGIMEDELQGPTPPHFAGHEQQQEDIENAGAIQVCVDESTTTTIPATLVVSESMTFTQDEIGSDHNDDHHDQQQQGCSRDGSSSSLTIYGGYGGGGGLPSTVPELVAATPLKEKSKKNPSVIWFLCLLLLFIVALLVVVLSIVVIVPSQDLGYTDHEWSQTSSSDQQQSPKVEERNPPFSSDLITSTLRALDDSTSPAYKANAWMLQDPNLHSYSLGRQMQRFALVSLFWATGGQNWTRNDNWLSYETHECDWFFQTTSFEEPCEDEGDKENEMEGNDDGREEVVDDDFRRKVVNIDLSNNNLYGRVPEEMFYFKYNRFVDFSFNKLFGPPPPLDSTSFSAQVVRINNNQMGGMVTVKAGHHPPGNLREVDFSNNLFQGEVLNSLAHVTSLEVLRASGNQFSGSLDGSKFGALTNLTVLDVADNRLSGSLPDEIASLLHLREINVAANDFTGTIPQDWMHLPKLELLNVSMTRLTGSIPQDLCDDAKGGLKPTVEIVASCSAITCCLI